MTFEHTRADRLLLIGHGSQDGEGIAECLEFAQIVAENVQLPVQTCFLEFAAPSVTEGLRMCVEAGAHRIVALPLFLGPAGHQKNDVPMALNWARAQWPGVQFCYGTPLGAQYPIVQALADRAAESAGRRAPTADTALLLVGRGSRDPDSNAEVARLARLLYEGRGYGSVETAFYSLAEPGVEAAIERCARLGARRIIVLPYLLFAGRICAGIAEQTRVAQERFPSVEMLVAAHLSNHPGVVAAVTQRYQEAVNGTAAMNCDVCKYRVRMAGFEDDHGLPQTSDHHHGLRGVTHRHADLSLLPLPARYRNGKPVSAAPMGAAPLAYDADGNVAWDQIWGRDDPDSPFCDLALAGGPPHRGALLEPVPPEVVAADPVGYQRALGELARGIRLVTGLPVAPDRYPGWIGVECTSEEMAIWLLRAIVVENICVRREGATLFLPAAPDFRLEYEVKNVITAIAKTHHYWAEHLHEEVGR